MWIISYEYEDASGKHYSQCKALKQGTQYSIGRSINCELQIQQDKSISRVHLIVKYEKNELTVINKGKLTKANNKPVLIDESIVIQNHDIILDIGGAPINVEIHFSYQEWKIPHKLSLEGEKSTVSQYGVKLCESFSKKSTLQIFSDGSSYTGCLFALIKGVPVVSTEFLSCICQLLKEDNYLDFKSSFQAIIKRFSLFPSYNYVPNALAKITVLVFEQKLFDTLRYTIESGSGSIKLLTSTAEINSFVNDNEKEIIVLSTNTVTDTQASKSNTPFYNTFRELGIEIHNPNEFVNAFIRNDLNALSERKQRIEAKNTKDTLPSAVMKPKTRIKPKVQLLDSLMCFGGGSSSKNESSGFNSNSKASDDQWRKVLDHESKNTNRSELKEPTSTPSKFSEITTPSTDAKENIRSVTTALTKEDPLTSGFDSRKRKRRPKVQQLGNLMMRENPPIVNGNFEDQNEGSLKRIKLENDALINKSLSVENSQQNDRAEFKNIEYEYESTEPSKEKTIKTNVNNQQGGVDAVKNSAISDESTSNDQPSSFKKSEKTLQRSKDRTTSIAKLETNFPERRPTRDIVNAIVETKQKEVRRFQEGMFEVDQSELTESSLQGFKDVSRVEKTKVKPRILHPRVVSDKSAIWAGRKNFKSFVKIWPTYLSLSSDQDTHGKVSYPAANTKENRYIRMKRYEYRKNGSIEDNMDNDIDEHFKSSNRIDGNNAQILQPSGETELTQEAENVFGPGFKSKQISLPEKNTLFITEDDDSYDDTSKTYTESEVHDKNTSREENNSLQSNRSVSFASNSTERSKYLDADTDDEEDENYTRRFNFRSRRRN